MGVSVHLRVRAGFNRGNVYPGSIEVTLIPDSRTALNRDRLKPLRPCLEAQSEQLVRNGSARGGLLTRCQIAEFVLGSIRIDDNNGCGFVESGSLSDVGKCLFDQSHRCLQIDIYALIPQRFALLEANCDAGWRLVSQIWQRNAPLFTKMFICPNRVIHSATIALMSSLTLRSAAKYFILSLCASCTTSCNTSKVTRHDLKGPTSSRLPIISTQ